MRGIGVKNEIVSLRRNFNGRESARVSYDVEKEKFVSVLIFLKKMIMHIVAGDNGLRFLRFKGLRDNFLVRNSGV